MHADREGEKEGEGESGREVEGKGWEKRKSIELGGSTGSNFIYIASATAWLPYDLFLFCQDLSM